MASTTIAHLHAASIVVFLTYCAIQDARTRQLSNATWVWAAALLMPLRIGLQWTEEPSILASILWGLGLSAFSFTLWIFQVWGGADSKGAMLLAWAIPPTMIGPSSTHALAWSIPVALLGVLVWQKLRGEGVPFYVLLAPTTVAALFIL